MNLPFILISFFLGLTLFPKEQKKRKLRIGETVRKLDLPGMLLFTVCIVLLLSFLLSLGDGIQYVQGILCLVSAGAFIWWEYQVDEPFIQIRMFRQERRLSLVYVQFIILNIFFYCLFFGLPSYFQDELGWRVEMTGLFMLCMSGVSIIVSPLTGKWVDRGDERHPVLASAVLMLAGASAMTFFFIPAPLWGKGVVLAAAWTELRDWECCAASGDAQGKSSAYDWHVLRAFSNMPLPWFHSVVCCPRYAVWG